MHAIDWSFNQVEGLIRKIDKKKNKQYKALNTLINQLENQIQPKH
jgi:hypothetical protein